jgi:hypothetical protein
MNLTHNSSSTLTHTVITRHNNALIRSLTLVILLTLMLLSPAAASADPLTLTITPGTLVGTPGGTVTFTGSITNTTGVTLNASDLFLNFSGFDPGVLSPIQTLGIPDFTLPNNTFSPSVSLFSVTLAPGTPPGTYTIDVFLEDINNNLSNVLTVSVNVNAAAVPEPATLLLLLTGLAGAGVTRHQWRKKLLR